FASLVRVLPPIVVLIATQNLSGNARASSIAGVPADHVAANAAPTNQVCSASVHSRKIIHSIVNHCYHNATHQQINID
ncbi:hypothetical protein V1971_33730, partial [Pseudomonas aeruginosa]